MVEGKGKQACSYSGLFVEHKNLSNNVSMYRSYL